MSIKLQIIEDLRVVEGPATVLAADVDVNRGEVLVQPARGDRLHAAGALLVRAVRVVDLQQTSH